MQIYPLIAEIGLPGLNGRQLADAAKELRPDLKILFMTGHAENVPVSLAAALMRRGTKLSLGPV
ncbi:hypothetical protein [Novosphingobium sp. 9U]|uniref:hypothetical protein n=1 Tax=Novosphingobium sp. 9U TaxID=2653158 RepID=UPI0012F0D8A5|nr:hypothetical protein [Novosphingobium sp. 9U]VWX54445.1 hypothetical protein NOVOSPHI9U_620031 [Novosphingobium sp. 9U]